MDKKKRIRRAFMVKDKVKVCEAILSGKLKIEEVRDSDGDLIAIGSVQNWINNYLLGRFNNTETQQHTKLYARKNAKFADMEVKVSKESFPSSKGSSDFISPKNVGNKVLEESKIDRRRQEIVDTKSSNNMDPLTAKLIEVVSELVARNSGEVGTNNKLSEVLKDLVTKDSENSASNSRHKKKKNLTGLDLIQKKVLKS